MQARYSTAVPSQTWEPGSGHAPNAQSKFWTLHKLQPVLSESSRAFCEAHATEDLWKHPGRNHLDSLPSKKGCRAFLDSCQSNVVRLELRKLTQVGEIFSRYNTHRNYVWNLVSNQFFDKSAVTVVTWFGRSCFCKRKQSNKKRKAIHLFFHKE